MSDNEEVTAAATGAAAAVAAVQDQQEQEQIVESATVAAEVATDSAVTAAEEATAAGQVAEHAAEAASEAIATAEQAQISLADVHARISNVEQKQDEFVTEARGFFQKLEGQLAPAPHDDVQKVKVTHHAAEDQQANSPEDNGSTGADRPDTGSAGSAATSRGRRKSFGRR